MSLKGMSQDELELLTHADLAELILTENKKAMNTPSLFHKICDLLGLTEEQYTNKIGDFYTSMTTDKRFLLLDSAEWDLKDRHVVDIVALDDDEEEIDEENLEEDIDEENLEEDSVEDNYDDEETLDDDDDDLDDLVVMSEDELGADE